MVTRRIRFALRLLAVSSTVLLLSGTGHLLYNTRATQSTTGSAIDTLVDDTMDSGDIPAGFAEELGYLPTEEAGSWVNPGGDCSFPVRIHPEAFETACRKHDLGYDLLRFAEANGDPTDPALRYSIDHRFHQDLVEACADVGCRLVANLYGLGVTINSIRQGYGPPTVEPLLPWILVWGATLAVASRGPIWLRHKAA